MEWTGYWYGFYTNKPIDFVFSEWRKKMSIINYQYDYRLENYNDEKNYHNKENIWNTLFCYKNKEMFEHHLEEGYNIDMDGEGCFMIQAKKAQFRGRANLFDVVEDDSNIKCAPHDIDLRFNSLFYYCLVLPEEPECSSFSQKIRGFLISILDDENDKVE
ncbi:hypothetical protein [Gilliamella apicola]|uniref:Uncharacterized protein n=2 Tax=Gilliamella apicola TaxID=1196095 RepID=A0A242NEQ1_9GAMM|nr:hypothetical protein [Gilliamella apicola]ORF44329.1 hypothetical protein B5800_12025 [Gilliamella apicola]ORF48149.1 hypothetical protein B5799_09920 [Gilliamella apicola]ORF50657.1 hypothetical protein B5803_09295 [Gilliamella apicola]ORF52058.1 hypothetical protein B5798_12450 [Gilliamella apicola]ORF52242.1 hypothetical protein B5802_10150 [Gilliamella apicola]